VPEIKAADVKRLRDATGAGMMDCKRALEEADGDFDRAATLVRERTGARMDARVGGRTAGEGLVHSYLHAPQPGLPAKIGVLLELNCETDFVAKSDGFRQLASDIAMHIAAANPAVVREEEVDPDEVAREREFAQNQARSEGKPDHIVERIVDGRLKSYFKEQVLLNQPFVRDDSKTVGDLVSEVQRTTGERVEVRRFARFQIGR
jgi:elongation factor Ts